MITVEEVGKRYVIHHEGKPQDTLRDQIMSNVTKAFSKKGNHGKQYGEEEFWALKNVNFQVNEGDRLGIIGRNGAGKSTLLKLLSRITEPTLGSIRLKGRVASLLEVGTGFHPELTGRENIYLNGAILGMSRAEIKRKFDEIVAFSGVEKFLDTPVKRYSSGMYVRLAFAVAAHLEPEILIVDEVLAVGDAEFQEKCIGKMDEVGRSGRTILFVSHQMGLISQLCNRAILLHKGSIKYDGTVSEAVGLYNTRVEQNLTYINTSHTKDIQFQKIEIHNGAGEITSQYGHDEPVYISLQVVARIPASTVQVTVALLDNWQRRLFTLHIPLSKFRHEANIFKATIRLQKGLMVPNVYNFHFDLFIPYQAIFDSISGNFPIRINDNGSDFASYEGTDYGFYFMNYDLIS